MFKCVIVNRNRKIQTSKAPSKSPAQGTSAFEFAGCPQDS